ncbi:hypothetical protein MYSEV_289 [Mythimna separata entomopoxvirus 'L']|uniref:Uncharacterized protein n=1 Tax=Mythimna separata entomopoxvirus 'L' TaxID=1293572 RepID=A0A916P1S6_9POXV|nr:hypothetical protein MYSEV_289 [Mythimna separata entomopoxvirus 'L']CCU56487.1 hypothetical protein MYSEV_289 [Mythimna separata entomopoxvirus 'L']
MEYLSFNSIIMNINYRKLSYFKDSKIVTKIGQINKNSIKYIIFSGEEQYRLSKELNNSEEISKYFNSIINYNTYFINKYPNMNIKYFPRRIELNKEKIKEYIDEIYEEIDFDSILER